MEHQIGDPVICQTKGIPIGAEPTDFYRKAVIIERFSGGYTVGFEDGETKAVHPKAVIKPNQLEQALELYRQEVARRQAQAKAALAHNKELFKTAWENQ